MHLHYTIEKRIVCDQFPADYIITYIYKHDDIKGKHEIPDPFHHQTYTALTAEYLTIRHLKNIHAFVCVRNARETKYGIILIPLNTETRNKIIIYTRQILK